MCTVALAKLVLGPFRATLNQYTQLKPLPSLSFSDLVSSHLSAIPEMKALKSEEIPEKAGFATDKEKPAEQ